MDWEKLFSYWGPISGLAVVVFLALYNGLMFGIEIREDYRRIKSIVCREQFITLSFYDAILNRMETTEPFGKIIQDLARSNTADTRRRRAEFCQE